MALPASDAFTRADAVNLGANWSIQFNAGVTTGITTNQVAGKGGGGNAASFWSADVFGNDHFSQATIATVNDGGVTVRAKGTTSATSNFYVLICKAAGNTVIQKNVNNTFTTIKTAFATFASADVAQLSVTGTTLTALKNGVSIGTQADASLTTGSAGLYMFGTVERFDDWSGDNVAVVSGDTQEWRGSYPPQKRTTWPSVMY